MTAERIAIVGAGLAGLACARVLFGAQLDVTLFEKSRGLGGRLATRRVGRMAFDHGAQYVVAHYPGLKDYLELATATGHGSPWAPAGVDPVTDSWFVGAPGMSALVKPLAAGLDVRRGLRVTGCERLGLAWWLKSESGEAIGPFTDLVLAVPAPQAIDLTRDLTASVEVAAELARVSMAPCWSAMIAFAERIVAPAEVLTDSSGPLAWAARDTGKPGRISPHDCWVLHAAPEWTRAHLDDPPALVAADLWREFDKWAGPTPRDAYQSAHLWRYARVEQPLGEPCVWRPDLRLGLCGDWCLGARAEAAWLSGTALAQQLLAAR